MKVLAKLDIPFMLTDKLQLQKGTMEDSVEIVIEKLLHATKDAVPKATHISFLVEASISKYCVAVPKLFLFSQVSDEANQCLSTILDQSDPFRCLAVCESYEFIITFSLDKFK